MTDKKVTEKNTKREIMKAYNEQLLAVKAAKAEKSSQRESVDREASDKVVESAAMLTTENIEYLSNNLAQDIKNSFKVLGDINEAIEIKRRELEDVHSIIAEADSLAALLDVKKSQEEETKVTQDLIANRHLEVMTGMKRDAEESLTRVRDDYKKKHEELEYDFHRKNQVMTDMYNDKSFKTNQEISARKDAADAELRLREEVLIDGEEEAKLLQAQIDSFPDVVIEAEKKAKGKATAIAERRNEFEIASVKKEMVHLEEKHAIITDTLKVKLASLLEETVYLKKQLEGQSEKVNDIATKAIDGAARTQQVHAYPNSYASTGGNGEVRA